MSAYGEFETIMCEERLLVEGLSNTRYHVEVSSQGAALEGYQGDERPEKAHLIIRRAHRDSASNDIGFARGTDGRFRAILSEYDRSIGYSNQWLGKSAAALQREPNPSGRKGEGLHLFVAKKSFRRRTDHKSACNCRAVGADHAAKDDHGCH